MARVHRFKSCTVLAAKPQHLGRDRSRGVIVKQKWPANLVVMS